MILNLHVKPNSKVDQLFFDEYGNLKVKIRAQPIDGKANIYLVEYLSLLFDVPKSQIRILKGENNQHKKVEIIGFEPDLTSKLHKIKEAK